MRENEKLEAISVAINRSVLVIGGGIAGMTASLDLAEGGYEVILIEKEQALGGHMAQLSKTFPDLHPALRRPPLKGIGGGKTSGDRSSLLFRVGGCEGLCGKFRSDHPEKNHLCRLGKMQWVWPSALRIALWNMFHNLRGGWEYGKRSTCSIPEVFPIRPVINRDHCRYFFDESCNGVKRFARRKPSIIKQEEERISEKVGAIVVATGFELYPKKQLGEYGYGEIPDVIDGLAFERMLSPNGPTKGKIIRPSDGKVPKEMVFIQCVASRDPDRYMPYCSRICCMYTAKHAKIYKEQVPDGQPYIFYMDIRSDCKGYEEFLQKTIEEKGLLYLRGRVSRVFQDDGRVKVLGVDTLTGKMVEVAADMVVLATAIVPSNGVKDLAAKLRATVDRHGFLTEAHIKLYPVESSTKGIYLAGCGQSPKDISDTVSQASATASKIQALLSTDKLLQDPLIAFVDEGICSGCGICVEICPYEAREMDPHRGISMVHTALCQGCGACIAACPNFACELRNGSANQVLRMVDTFIT